MRVIGLTGGIAAGKSTVAALLAERGAEVIDCDRLARDVTAPGTPGLEAVLARFGESLRTPEGGLDRAELACRVFADARALAELEAIVHPLVTAEVDRLLACSTAPVVVVEAIKLLEAGYRARCNGVWVVTAPEEVRLQRLESGRGMSPEEARRRLAAQGDDAVKRAAADEVIVNAGGRDELARAVAEAWSRSV